MTADSRPMIVVAALIEQDGKLLICQRRKSDSFPLKWEFPGGKVHENESPPQALRRELREELGIEARVGAEVFRTTYRYAEQPRELELIFFRTEIREGPLQNLAFAQVAWAEPGSLPAYDFLAADRELIEAISDGRLRIAEPPR